MVHWLADVHSGSFAPAFTLSQGESEAPASCRMRIVSVVSSNVRKKRHGDKETKLDNCDVNYIDKFILHSTEYYNSERFWRYNGIWIDNFTVFTIDKFTTNFCCIDFQQEIQKQYYSTHN